MYQKQSNSNIAIQNQVQPSARHTPKFYGAKTLALWLGGLALLSTGSVISGDCPNTITGSYRTTRPAVYSDCGTTVTASDAHNLMIYDAGVIISPERPYNISPPPGADANPLSGSVEYGLYEFTSDGQCPTVTESPLNGTWSMSATAFRYYCGVWRNTAGREQRISAQWGGSLFGWRNIKMTDTAIITTYPITTTANPSYAGSINCIPNPVNEGSSSTCTATVNSGYAFDGYTGDCSGTNTTCVLDNVTAAKTVTANFHCVDAPVAAGIINWTETYECDWVSAPADVEIESPGDVEFRANQEISIGPGFRVGTDAKFKGIIVP